jgi:CHASE2 domain-containing sensor protein
LPEQYPRADARQQKAKKMADWQDYWIAAPVVLASLAAGLATFILLDQEDLSADHEKRWRPSDAGAESSLEKV